MYIMEASYAAVLLSLVLFTCVQSQRWDLPTRYDCRERPVQAICRMLGDPSYPEFIRTHGIIVFTQRVNCHGYYALQTKINLGGLPADGNFTYHSLQVHVGGDLRRGCVAGGARFNPYRLDADRQTWREFGDLGNVLKDPFGYIQGAIFESRLSLVGPFSIIGRSVALYEKPNFVGPLAHGEERRSEPGSRVACCLVERI